MGLVLKEHIQIKSNNTEMLIGEVVSIHTSEQAIMPDGYLDLESIDLVTISGLDSYHVTQRLDRLSYAKPEESLVSLNRRRAP